MQILLTLILSCVVIFGAVAPAEAMACKQDAVKVGATCLDKYEGSVWTISPANASSLTALQQLAEAGTATLVTVAAIAGAVQVGGSSDDYGAGCPDDGAGCTAYFALSIAGVPPSTRIT